MAHVSFGEAMRAAREAIQPKVSQDLVVEWLRARGVDASQSKVSDWENDIRPPEPHVTFEIERVLGVKPGELSHHLGYMPVEACIGVVPALIADQALSEGRKARLIELYVDLRALDETSNHH